jgi:hypothetical protein
MIQIEAVEVKYFRSIYRLRVKDLRDVNVFAGRNDIGKSNLLKALNLFFNSQTDWQSPLEFERDFNRQRLEEVRRETVKGKQFIQVTVDFLRGPRYEKSLPERFQVTRTWYRDSAIAEPRDSIGRQFSRGEVKTKNEDRARASLQRYLGTVRFEYVPAVKDRSFFAYLLGRLQDVIFEQSAGQSETAAAVERLNTSVEREAQELHAEFAQATGIPIRLHLPVELGDLFRAFAVATRQGEDELPLDLRGDGIRARFLPSLLHYVSQHSRLQYIWGFEEPENSLEHGLATSLAGEMSASYAREAQIFVTTHSPAFLVSGEPPASIFRVTRAGGGTVAEPLPDAGTAPLGPPALQADLGLLELQRRFQREYSKQLASLEGSREQAQKLRAQIEQLRRPVLLVEGKWDVALLEHAWKRIRRGAACPFAILGCSPLPAEQDSGGVGVLKMALESVRPDEPPTVGLFDRDREGTENGFEGLGRNFVAAAGDPDMKLHKGGTAAAILLPTIPGRENHAHALNLPLEFYFADNHLAHKVDGKGLILKAPEIVEVNRATGRRLGGRVATEAHLMMIDHGSKKDFVEHVMPTLPDEAFARFGPLFDVVERTLREMRNGRKRLPTKKASASRRTAA